jgi:hypothetical protein
MELSVSKREIIIKLVYYGPALSGKTTNLQALHYFLRDGSASDLLTLDTKNDRTLFFDLLPIEYMSKSNFKVRFKLFTVPGQVIHASTRKMVLKSADGVVFVADSQKEQRKNNNYSYRDLLNNLSFNNLGGIPIVIQFNKRDLPESEIIDESEIEAFASKLDSNVFKASALSGDGVLETFAELIKVSYDRLDALYKFSDKFGIYKTEILKGVFSNIKNG